MKWVMPAMKLKAGGELSEGNAHIVCHQEPITHLLAVPLGDQPGSEYTKLNKPPSPATGAMHI